MRRAIGAALSASVLLAGCTGDPGPRPEDAAPTTPPLVLQTAAPDDAAVTTEVATTTDGAATTDGATSDGATSESAPVDLAEQLGDPQLLDQVRWVLEHLDPEAEGPPATEQAERIAASMREELSVVELGAAFAQVRTLGPFTVAGATRDQGPGTAATVQLDGSQPLVLRVVLDDDGQIAGLLFQPDTSGERPVITAWPELDAALAELDGTTQVVAGEVSAGTCEVVHTTAGLDPGGEPAPSASVIKLLVLLAVADAVTAGDLTWDDEVVVTSETRSLPSGLLQDRPDGASLTVAEAARLMISISDNTATDLLIDAVGQRALRTAAEGAGVDATRVMPIATTRQFFQLGWQVDPEVRGRWLETQVPETREAILADLPEDLAVDPATVTTPVWEEGVDWFLTGGEICGLHAQLQQRAATPQGAALREILAENPGVEPVTGTAYQAFKGGSAPGVLALSFYVEADGEAPGEGTVLVIQTRGTVAIDQLRATTIAEGGLQHLVGSGG